MTRNISDATASTAKALNRLSEIAMGFVGTQTLATGVQLGVFEALQNGPKTLEELAEELKLQPVSCRRLLMALASLDLVACRNGVCENTELGRYCTSQAPVNLGAASNMRPFDHMCEYLPDAVREYGPRWQQALGAPAEDTFAALYADPVGLRHFADLMDGFSMPQGQLIAESFDFSGCQCIMDVAGGPGGQAIEIGLKHPHLRGIITDLEPVCVVARERIEAKKLADRFIAKAADLIEGPYPSGADVILLGHILHDWSDDTCRKILTNCANALPTGGSLLISESVLASDFSGRNLANLKDMIMLIANEAGARERSAEEYEALLDVTGFDVVEIVEMEAPRDLLIAKKR